MLQAGQSFEIEKRRHVWKGPEGERRCGRCGCHPGGLFASLRCPTKEEPITMEETGVLDFDPELVRE